MARLRGTNVLNHTVRGHQAEDGYVLVGADGYTVVSTTMPVDSVFSSFKRTGAGLWTATLKEAFPCNMGFFRAEPQIHTSDTPSVVFFQLLDDNVGATGTTGPTGLVPQVVHFEFCDSSGTAADLPANAGFKYEAGLQVSTAYYTKVY